MEKYNIIIKKDSIIVEKNGIESLEYNVLLFPMLIAYILQRLSEKTFLATNLQDGLSEYLFEINNNDSYENIQIPDSINTLIGKIEHEIESKYSIEVEFEDWKFNVDISELGEIYQEVIDEHVAEYFWDIVDAEVKVKIDQGYGKLFSDYIIKFFVDLKNSVEILLDKKICAECQIFYEGEILFEAIEETHMIREIQIAEGLREGILLNFKYSSEKKDEYRYMHFPFWNAGDMVELSIILDNNQWFLKGKHRISKIISMLEI